jgi:hypothetical protein
MSAAHRFGAPGLQAEATDVTAATERRRKVEGIGSIVRAGRTGPSSVDDTASSSGPCRSCRIR